MKFKVLIFGCLALSLFSCKTRLNTTRPNEAYLSSAVQNKPSTIALTVDLDIPELEKGLNNSLKGNIYEDNKFDDDNLMMKVSKTSDIHFTVNGNVINCTLPLKVWVKTGYKKQLLGLTAEDYYEANGALTVNASVAFSLTKDWEINTITTINNYKWTQEPTIKAAGVNIPITTFANIALKALKGKISSSVDKSIAKKASLRSQMEQTWNELQDPIQVNKDYDVWLKINPIAIYSSPIVGNGNKLQINLGMNSIIDTYMGTTPPSSTNKNKLSEYKVVNNIKPAFSISSNITVSYNKLNEIAQKLVIGQEFKDGNKHVRIDSLKLYGQNDMLVVQTTVSGTVNGIIYCVGKLAYDNNTQTLSVTDFDFEVNTKSTLLKSANWLLHKTFLKKIEPMLTIPLKDQVNSMMTTSNNFLKNYQIRKGVTLNGNLNNILFDKIIITKDAIIINGDINGNLKIGVGDLF